MRKIFFVHIPKTAGKSVEKYFFDALGEQVCSPCYSEVALFKRQRKLIDGWEFFSGHMLYSAKTFVDKGAFCFTFLREPLNRALSVYNYVHTNPKMKLHSIMKGVSFEDWLTDDRYAHHLINHQVRYLGSQIDVQKLYNSYCVGHKGIDGVQDHMRRARAVPIDKELYQHAVTNLGELDHIGFQEEFDSSMTELIEKMRDEFDFNWPSYKPIRENITQMKVLTKENLTDQALSVFNERARYELMLYKYAKELAHSEKSEN